jgi:hypothetical protein
MGYLLFKQDMLSPQLTDRLFSKDICKQAMPNLHLMELKDTIPRHQMAIVALLLTMPGKDKFNQIQI